MVLSSREPIAPDMEIPNSVYRKRFGNSRKFGQSSLDRRGAIKTRDGVGYLDLDDEARRLLRFKQRQKKKMAAELEEEPNWLAAKRLERVELTSSTDGTLIADDSERGKTGSGTGDEGSRSTHSRKFVNFEFTDSENESGNEQTKNKKKDGSGEAKYSGVRSRYQEDLDKRAALGKAKRSTQKKDNVKAWRPGGAAEVKLKQKSGKGTMGNQRIKESRQKNGIGGGDADFWLPELSRDMEHLNMDHSNGKNFEGYPYQQFGLDAGYPSDYMSDGDSHYDSYSDFGDDSVIRRRRLITRSARAISSAVINTSPKAMRRALSVTPTKINNRKNLVWLRKKFPQAPAVSVDGNSSVFSHFTAKAKTNNTNFEGFLFDFSI